MINPAYRARLLAAAMAEHPTLSAAMAAAQAAVAWLRGENAPAKALPVPAAPAIVDRPPPARQARRGRRPQSEEWTPKTLAVIADAGETGAGAASVAAALGIAPSAASWRLRRLADAGRIVPVTGSRGRYRMNVEPATRTGEASPAVEAPPAEPPQLPENPDLVEVDITEVKRFLQSRDYSVIGGPDVYRVDGTNRDAEWMVARANRIRAGMGKPPFAVKGLPAPIAAQAEG